MTDLAPFAVRSFTAGLRLHIEGPLKPQPISALDAHADAQP